MKLLLDQGLPRTTVEHLAGLGVHSVHVGNIGMSTASDESILKMALKESMVLVTLDSDFHALLVLSGSTGPSVIRIRIEGLRGKRLADLLVAVLKKCHAALVKGCIISVQEHSIRIRRLPVLK